MADAAHRGESSHLDALSMLAVGPDPGALPGNSCAGFQQNEAVTSGEEMAWEGSQGNRDIDLSQFAIDDLSRRGTYRKLAEDQQQGYPMNAYLPGGTPSLMVPAVLSSSPSTTITRAPGFT